MLLIVDITFLKGSFQPYQISCIIGFVLSLLFFVCFLCRDWSSLQISKIVSVLMVVLIALSFIYEYNTEHNYVFFIICMFSVAITQSINLNFFVLIFLIFCLIAYGIVLSMIKSSEIFNKIYYPVM